MVFSIILRKGQNMNQSANNVTYGKTLSKYEKQIVTDVLVRGQYTTIDVASFNHALANSLPTWRTEQLVDTNQVKKTLAYVDYMKTLLRTYKV